MLVTFLNGSHTSRPEVLVLHKLNPVFLSLRNPSIEHFSGAWDEPWATLQFAVERLRVLRTGAATPGPDTVATIHLSHSQGEDIHRVAETIKLSGSRDSWLVIKNVHGTEPLVSGGIPLDLEWQQEGDILTGRVNATCGEMYYGDYR